MSGSTHRSDNFKSGLKARKTVLGDTYVEASVGIYIGIDAGIDVGINIAASIAAET